MPFELTRRSFMLSVGALIPVLRSSPSKFQKAGAHTAGQRLAAIEARLGGRLGLPRWIHKPASVSSTARANIFPCAARLSFCSFPPFCLASTQIRKNSTVSFTTQRADLLDYAPITKAHVQEGGMTISALSAAAIEYSDNTAANLLLDVLGGPAAVTHYARTLGDSVTRLDRNEPTLNTAIPGDLRDTTTPSAMLADMKRNSARRANAVF